MAIIPYNNNLKEISKDLRRKPTAAEERLWERLELKHPGYVFYRQKPIGDYIVDFYCNQAKLVIEVDGDYHLDKDVGGNDRVRNAFMKNLGLTVLRFSNHRVLNDIDKVAAEIRLQLEKCG